MSEWLTKLCIPQYAAGRPGTLVVDCTATDKTIPALLHARERNYKVVLANKKPLTSAQEVYNRLTRAGATGNATEAQGSAEDVLTLSQCRWETTVGAGLPVIATLNRLVTSGDAIHRIAGTFYAHTRLCVSLGSCSLVVACRMKGTVCNLLVAPGCYSVSPIAPSRQISRPCPFFLSLLSPFPCCIVGL